VVPLGVVVEGSTRGVVVEGVVPATIGTAAVPLEEEAVSLTAEVTEAPAVEDSTTGVVRVWVRATLCVSYIALKTIMTIIDISRQLWTFQDIEVS
jgi:hypothetical protein